MTDEEIREEGGAEQAPPEAPAEETGEPRVAAPLHPDRQVTVRFVHETAWQTATGDGILTEVIAEGDERELPRETAMVFVGMGAAVWAGDEELAVQAAGEVATRSRRRRK
jgi:hypothetical protein